MQIITVAIKGLTTQTTGNHNSGWKAQSNISWERIGEGDLTISGVATIP
jgi:hypothetical protein